MEWALIQPWRSMQEGLLNTGMNSTQEQLRWAIHTGTFGAELCRKKEACAATPIEEAVAYTYEQQIWGRDVIQRETGRKSWGWLAESSDVHSFAAGVCAVTAAPAVWSGKSLGTLNTAPSGCVWTKCWNMAYQATVSVPLFVHTGCLVGVGIPS